MSYDIYTGLLKAFPLPAAGGADVHFAYDGKHPQFAKLRAKYPVEAVAGGGGDFSKAENLLRWVSAHVSHKGDYAGAIAHNSLDLLEYAYGKEGRGINCVALATVLSECLLAVGVMARGVFLMPCSPYDGDNHVVTHVYIREMRKWVMMDPTLNGYVKNEAGTCLSLLEMREALADQEPLFFNAEANYNGEEWTAESAVSWVEYFAKNLFYFKTYENSTFGGGNVIGDGVAAENRLVLLSPRGYDPKQIQLNNIDYRIKRYGGSPEAQGWRERVRQEKYSYCSSADFEKAPGTAK